MKEVIIYAMGASRFLCPYDAEVWGCNQSYYPISEFRGRLDKVFLAHTQVYKDGEPLFDWDTFNKLAERGVEIINTHRIKRLRSKLYPFKRICKKFDTDYFSDTIAYMVAYAIDQATTKDLKLKYPLKLKLYGVDMLSEHEYSEEKGGIEFWLGLAKGLGIKYEIAKGSALLRTITGVPYGIRIPKVKEKPPNFSSIEGQSTDGRHWIEGEIRLELKEKIQTPKIDDLLIKVRMPNDSSKKSD